MFEGKCWLTWFDKHGHGTSFPQDFELHFWFLWTSFFVAMFLISTGLIK